jgi:membrane protease YdiL (CAAX protease family)
LRGAAALFAFLPLYFLLLLVSTGLASLLGLPVESHSLIRILEQGGGALAGLVIIQAALLAPLVEEVLYRGFGIPAFEGALGPAGAVLVTSLIFAVNHPGFMSLIPMLGLGTLFAGLQVTSPGRSLVAPITAHALFNGLTLALVLAVQAS